MFLNRDQVVAMNCVRDKGFDPVHAIVLTSHGRDTSVVSVLAIKDGKRYNLRVSIDCKSFSSKIVSVHELNIVIDMENSKDLSTIDGCVVKAVSRKYVKLGV